MADQSSLGGLDWINFFMADVATGIGPFLAIYLTATRHWDASKVGMVDLTDDDEIVDRAGICDDNHPARWSIAALVAALSAMSRATP